MKIFLAGAAGAIGRQLTPELVSRGHLVVGTTQTPERFEAIRNAGAEPVVMDGLDRQSVLRSVAAARPDVIVHQMTALSNMRSLRNIDNELAMTNQLRTIGTENLLEAARAAGVDRFVAQSYTGWPNIREGGRVKSEDDPLDPNPPRTMRQTLDAIRQLEDLVLHADGIAGTVLRYGGFYGPGTSLGADGKFAGAVLARQLPVVGDGAGVWSFIHVADAARATRIAIEQGAAGVFNIVDDDPAEVAVWLPDLADALGARPPRHVSAWLGRLLIGESGLSMMTAVRGSSNAKAKRVLGWHPEYASWRDGFRRGLGAEAGAVPYPKAV